MEHIGSARATGASESAALAARGLLLALAAPSIAAVAAGGAPQGFAGALRSLADLATIPAFFAVAGWLSAGALSAPRFISALRPILPGALCGVAGALAAVLLAPLAGLEPQAALALSAPVWSLALLPALYALVARPLAASPMLLCALGVIAHVFGVILGKPALIHFIFFLVGLAVASRAAPFAALVRDEPDFALGAGPFLSVLAAAVAIRFGQTGQAPSLAAIGPIGLALGAAAGPSFIASALALGRTRFAEPVMRLGRVAPALAVFWLPLCAILLALANRGLAPSFASALLMAISSLLLIAVLADLVLDLTQKAGFPRAAAQS